jgi:Coenzyme PQQ synthesis protein D (PqqD)
MVPIARKNVLVRELEDEVLMYDLESERAHCLNQTAAIVWKHCDGKTSVDQILHILQSESHSSVSESIVLLALEQLNKARLLEQPISTADWKSRGPTRREVLRKLGAASAVALPVISSILIAPAAAHASAACTTTGRPCAAHPECCSHICVLGRCA